MTKQNHDETSPQIRMTTLADDELDGISDGATYEFDHTVDA